MKNNLDLTFNEDTIPEMKLYIIDYFKVVDNEIDLINHILNNKVNKKYIRLLEYLRYFKGESDVIKITDLSNNIKYCSVMNNDYYVTYNEEESINNNTIVWNYELGDIRDLYNEFRKRGIVFENDIYKKIDEINNNNIKRLERRIRETYN